MCFSANQCQHAAETLLFAIYKALPQHPKEFRSIRSIRYDPGSHHSLDESFLGFALWPTKHADPFLVRAWVVQVDGDEVEAEVFEQPSTTGRDFVLLCRHVRQVVRAGEAR